MCIFEIAYKNFKGGKQMKTTPELQEAVSAYQNGDADSFNKIYELSYQYLYTCVIHVVKNEDMAMDMLQETYLEISRNINQLKSIEDFLSWSAVIANHKCFAYLKKQKDVLLFDNDTDEENTDFFENIADDEEIIPESILQDREKQRLIMEVIDNLNDMQRLCIIGYYYNEQKQEEIAQELGIPVNTVKTNLSRAKVKIKDAIIELDEKKGTRLYSLAPFMLLLFTKEAEACEIKPMSEELSNEIASKTGKGAAASDVQSATDDDISPISDNDKSSAAKAFLSTAKGKLVIGIAIAGGAAIIGATIYNAAQSNEAPPIMAELETQSSEAETLAEPESTTEAVEETTEVIETESVAETETEQETETLEELAISGIYEEYGTGNLGLIPVMKDGKYGLVTYDNEVIVPFEYTSTCSMVNEEGYSFFRNDNGSYIFDKNGNLMFHTDRTVWSINEGVVFAEDSGDYDVRYAYYKLDGTLIHQSDDSYPDEKGGTAMNEGYAFFLDDTLGKMSSNGAVVDPILPSDFSTQNNTDAAVTEDGTIAVQGSGQGGIMFMERPIGALKNGYYVLEPLSVNMDNYGIYSIRNADWTKDYRWDMRSLYDAENMVFSTSGAYWQLSEYSVNGTYFFNYGTLMCARIYTDDYKKYYLVDVSKLQNRGDEEYNAIYPEWTEETWWDFSRTVITDEALIYKADYIGFSDKDYWLVNQGDEWGYIDHSGNVMAMYDDASDFYNGKAIVVDEGIAYIIDETFTKIEELGPARSAANYGEVFSIVQEDSKSKMITLD